MEIACDRVGGIKLEANTVPAGADTYVKTGASLPDTSVQQAREADAILLAAMGDPDVRYPDGTEITPQIELRFILGLYAGVRPVRSIPGVPLPLGDKRSADIDFVLIRESIEGLFAPDAKGTLENDSVATETLVITRDVSEKLFNATFKIWQKRRKRNRGTNRVTCVDKANVFGAFAFFRKIFYEVANAYDAPTDHAYVDAMAMHLITRPWDFDVMVTENIFGDILSDQAAALVGGMGYAPSADIGDDHAVFQPCHGSAPDIAGKGLANPTAMFLSGAMLLDWLGDKHQDENALKAADLIERAVFKAFAGGQLRTCELGGNSGLMDVNKAVTTAIKELSV
ncbi:UNVERIFIED_CONTAM: hypothetical protein GTU68_006201 [Idotea baltica]|nr:hypothetical protein [Idotea baltica]